MDYEKIKKLKDQVAAKSWVDDAFRELLMKNPKKALASVFKFEVSDDFEIKIFEETASSLVIVIPEKAGEELSDDQLEKVAGGWGCLCDCVSADCFGVVCK